MKQFVKSKSEVAKLRRSSFFQVCNFFNLKDQTVCLKLSGSLQKKLPQFCSL